MQDINLLAVLAAAVSSFILGGLWYSPALFGKAWIRESGYDESQAGHPARVFGLSFVFSLVAALVFAWWLGPSPDFSQALFYGLSAGLGLVATSFGINYQFSNRSVTLLLIDGGYHTVQFTLYGLVLGLWH